MLYVLILALHDGGSTRISFGVLIKRMYSCILFVGSVFTLSNSLTYNSEVIPFTKYDIDTGSAKRAVVGT